MPRKSTKKSQTASSGTSGVDSKSKNVGKGKKGDATRSRRSKLKQQLATDQAGDGLTLESAKIEQASTSGAVEANKLLLDSFNFERVLSENPTSKSIVLYGKFAESENKVAIILAEKTAFSSETASNLFTDGCTSFTHNFQNDIYGQYSSDSGTKLTVIYPATEKHVKKYSQQRSVIVQETGHVYATYVRPYAESQALSLQWVDNILEGRAEADRVIYNDEDSETGFLLLPDLKWSQKNIENLYVLAIVRKKGILCLRELDAMHLPLLENVLKQGRRAIADKYKVPANQIRAYIHYHPSYYHLHVHFTLVGYQAPGSMVGQSHLLEDVIENIKHVDPNYYANRILTYQIREDSPILPLVETN